MVKPKNQRRSPRDPLAYAETVYKDLVSELRTEIIRLKSAHAEELARVIEENKKLLALAQGAGPKLTDSTDQETESGSLDSTPLATPNDASVTNLLAMLANGTPFQRIQARSMLEQIDHDARRLGTERDKLRRDYDAIKLEVDRLKAAAKPDAVVAPKPPEPVQPTN